MKEKRPLLPPHLCSPSLLSHCHCIHTLAVPGVSRSLLGPQSCSMWHVVTFISLSKCKFGLYTLML